MHQPAVTPEDQSHLADVLEGWVWPSSGPFKPAILIEGRLHELGHLMAIEDPAVRVRALNIPSLNDKKVGWLIDGVADTDDHEIFANAIALEAAALLVGPAMLIEIEGQANRNVSANVNIDTHPNPTWLIAARRQTPETKALAKELAEMVWKRAGYEQPSHPLH